MTRINDYISEADPSQQILVSDTGNDQTLITKTWTILQRTGREVTMTGAFAGRNVGEVFPVVSAVAKLVCEDGKTYAAFVHEALYDDNDAQCESLLSVHQSLRDVRNGIDDRARCERDIYGNPGRQMARFGQIETPFFFDGTKCFFIVQPITEDEMRAIPHVTLTDGSTPYEPLARLHSRRRHVKETTEIDWKRCLGFIPDHVVHKTLMATTQLVPTVESETREIMRDHLQTRLPELKVRRMNDTCHVDTFFSSIPSVRGYTCWNLFSFQKSGLDVLYLMHRRSQSPSTLSRMISDFGAPCQIKSDNAPEFQSKRWTDHLRTMSISQLFTEPHHPNQNLAERRGGMLKAATTHLLRITGAPLTYWCFALEYMSLLRSVTARRSLNWMSPHERHWGDRPDISVFRFVFWEPIWFYNPRQAFPKSKMMKGRFLGIAKNVGDAFCYLILSQPESELDGASPQVLARSVIRRRFPSEQAPVVSHNDTIDSITFYKSDGITPLDVLGDDSEENDPITDVVLSTEEEESLRMNTSMESQTPNGVNPEDLFENGIVEVYGPPTLTKRQRIPNEDGPSDTVSETNCASSPLPRARELLNQLDSADVNANTSTALPHESNTDLLVTGNSTTPSVADVMTSGLAGDDRRDDDREAGPLGVAGSHLVTQEVDDVAPDVVDEVNHQMQRVAEDSAEDEQFDSIDGHEWIEGVLMFRIRWTTNEISMLPFSVVKRDFPSETAKYILRNRIANTESYSTGGRYTRWARRFERQLNRTVRRLISSFAASAATELDSGPPIRIESNLPSGTRLIRRTAHAADKSSGTRRKRKKPGRISRPVQIKYGVVVPQSVRHALDLDSENGDDVWLQAIRKEVASLLALNCFQFFSPDYKPSSDYQFTKLSMIFEVKQEGRRKARLVAGGHMVDPMGINPRSTVVKGISVRLLDLIAHRDNLGVLCGDIGNAFITADCMEKVYSRAGPEFEDREGSILVFKKALYGLRSSSRAFRAHFADFLRNMGFSATRYDRDVWMRLREECDGYDYICTHVDDFKIVARDPSRWQEQISAAFLLKSVGPPNYYLGNDYNFSEEENAWVLSCATYVKECVRRIESEFDLEGDLWPHRTPLPEGCHPELDESDLLTDVGIRRFQTLIGMAQWACTIGRLDISFAVSSLSRFSAAPRTHHLELALHLFGYLKKNPNRRLVLDSRPLLVEDSLLTDSFHPDFLEDYPDACEDVDDTLPQAFGSELLTSVFFDADHAHDHVTRRSITGLIVFVGSAPVIWQSKRQGCIATSTYCAEFVAMRSAVEEAISIRYMLRCLGIPVTKPTNLFGDNFGVIQSAQIPEGELKKKHIAISYHYVREAITARIVNAQWCRSHENFADICTKALGTTIFTDLVNDMMA